MSGDPSGRPRGNFVSRKFHENGPDGGRLAGRRDERSRRRAGSVQFPPNLSSRFAWSGPSYQDALRGRCGWMTRTKTAAERRS
jgi:hypothetical protein